MLYGCVQRFHMMGTVRNFLENKQGLLDRLNQPGPVSSHARTADAGNATRLTGSLALLRGTADCEPTWAAGRHTCRSRASRNRKGDAWNVLGIRCWPCSFSANTHAPSMASIDLYSSTTGKTVAGEFPRRFPGPRVGDRRARGRASPQRSLLLLIKR